MGAGDGEERRRNKRCDPGRTMARTLYSISRCTIPRHVLPPLILSPFSLNETLSQVLSMRKIILVLTKHSYTQTLILKTLCGIYLDLKSSFQNVTSHETSTRLPYKFFDRNFLQKNF